MAEVVCAEYTHIHTHIVQNTYLYQYKFLVQKTYLHSKLQKKKYLFFYSKVQISSAEDLSALEICTQLKRKVPVCRSSVQRATHFPTE